MSKKTNKIAPAVTEEVTPIVATVEATQTEQIETTEATEDAPESPKEVVAEKAKRARSYSQTAVNTDDLERLNAFKLLIKETRKLNVSNQVILAAALDCLATTENMEAFLKSLVTTAADKQRTKDLAAFAALKAKLEGNVPNEDSTEEFVEAAEEAAADEANEA